MMKKNFKHGLCPKMIIIENLDDAPEEEVKELMEALDNLNFEYSVWDKEE